MKFFKKDLKEISDKVSDGVDIIQATVSVIDDNKDGKISLSEIKRHKWTILTISMSLLIGSLLGPDVRTNTVDYLQGNMIAVLGMLFTFCLGWASYWIFITNGIHKDRKLIPEEIPNHPGGRVFIKDGKRYMRTREGLTVELESDGNESFDGEV